MDDDSQAQQPPAEDRPSRPRGRRTAALLLDAAVEEFTAHGYHDARIARIAERAGTSYGTFYLYFTDKTDVLWEALEPTRTGLADVLRTLGPLTPGPAGRAELEAWVRRFCDHQQRHMPMFRALVEAQAASEDIARNGVEMLGEYRRILAARIRESDAIGIDPNLAALVIYATLERTNFTYYYGSLVASYREIVTVLTEFVHRSLFGAPAASAA
ncbi:TetR/AcrR family transcriptional regulator [Actinomadura chibensis]|uniref:TetR/AcrR family transcriptional regulator n=1 Tax=Actinomadura chibensis TaxID=392828 RepID=A0A5D0NDQ4_9ACTN|nr:TetR/AcrR family transcriptional regulator [Actinomadura chibensis]TYB42335.1 TetR/AcrR family transcriptional regulator [Actinomadura chibensis]